MYKRQSGESPVKCGGKVLIIDGGFSRAYHKETGIAGYTLIYNSYGMTLTAHEPFESAETAIHEEKDIVSRQVAVKYTDRRQPVSYTHLGTAWNHGRTYRYVHAGIYSSAESTANHIGTPYGCLF